MQNLTLETLLFVCGAVLIAVAILGGGIRWKDLQVLPVGTGVRAASAVLGLMLIGLSVYFHSNSPGLKNSDKEKPRIEMSAIEWNMNRQSGDYQVLHKSDNPIVCSEACLSSDRCKSWTVVKRNESTGAEPKCLLKEVKPEAQPDPCCISGYKIYNQ